MILVNKTAYETADLRKLLTAVHEHMAKTEGRLQGWGRGWGREKITVKIKVTYSRNKWVTGCAAYNGFDCDLRLPKTQKKHCTVEKFVYLAYHEMMHLYGYNHKQYQEIQREEMAELLSGTGYTLDSELPITLSQERIMKAKISGTTFKVLDLTGVPGIASQKEVKRGKGFVYELEVGPEGAAEIVKRLQAKDTAESGLSYEARYAARMDAKKLDKAIHQATEAAPETAEASTR